MEFPSSEQSSLELEAAAIRLKLEQISKDQKGKETHSVANKIKQLSQQ